MRWCVQQIRPGMGAQLTVHDVQVDDSYNAMKLSISGRPLMPMLIMLAPPSDAWDPFDMGVALVLVGAAVLSVGLTWAWFGCMELSFDIDKRERGLIPSDSESEDSVGRPPIGDSDPTSMQRVDTH